MRRITPLRYSLTSAREGVKCAGYQTPRQHPRRIPHSKPVCRHAWSTASLTTFAVYQQAKTVTATTASVNPIFQARVKRRLRQSIRIASGPNKDSASSTNTRLSSSSAASQGPQPRTAQAIDRSSPWRRRPRSSTHSDDRSCRPGPAS